MKRMALALALGIVLLVATSATGVSPASAQQANAWVGFYYNNMSFQGQPAFTRNDPYIDFTWGSWGPGGGISGTQFSVRWLRWLWMDRPGYWKFTTITDDGVRLWVDDQLVIDAWYGQPATARSVTLNLTQAFHNVKMEYYQNCCIAEAHFSVEYQGSPTPPVPPLVWHGEYFDNPILANPPVLFRDDVNLAFDWGTAPPGLAISQGGNWSARWSSKRPTTATGYHTVTATASDGVRVWVDEVLVINAWRDQAPTTYTAAVYLSQGDHNWRVEYYKRSGRAYLNVNISPGGNPNPNPNPQPGPQPGDLAIDTRNASFQKGGSGSGWIPFANGYGGIGYWTMNNTYAQGQYNWARWYLPRTRACYYEVSVYIPAGVATTRNARYWVSHAGKYELRRVNQSAYANQWVSLGAFNFSGNGSEYVTVSDVTQEPFMSTRVVVDSVNFAPRCTMW
jgi:hypothetical protein